MSDYKCFAADDPAERSEEIRGVLDREEAAQTYGLRHGLPCHVVVEDWRGNRSSVSVSRERNGRLRASVT